MYTLKNPGANRQMRRQVSDDDYENMSLVSKQLYQKEESEEEEDAQYLSNTSEEFFVTGEPISLSGTDYEAMDAKEESEVEFGGGDFAGGGSGGSYDDSDSSDSGSSDSGGGDD